MLSGDRDKTNALFALETRVVDSPYCCCCSRRIAVFVIVGEVIPLRRQAPTIPSMPVPSKIRPAGSGTVDPTASKNVNGKPLPPVKSLLKAIMLVLWRKPSVTVLAPAVPFASVLRGRAGAAITVATKQKTSSDRIAHFTASVRSRNSFLIFLPKQPNEQTQGVVSTVVRDDGSDTTFETFHSCFFSVMWGPKQIHTTNNSFKKKRK